MMGNNVVGILRGELLGEVWTATLTHDGWQTDNDFMSVALESYTNEIYKELIDPMDQRAWGVGALLQAAEDFNATAELNPKAVSDRQSEALQPIAYHSRINPVLPPPRRPLRYGWEMTRELDDGRKRWKGTEEDKGKYRTQRIKPGTRVKSSGDNRRSIGEHIDTLLESPESFTPEHRDDLRSKLLTLTRDQFATLRSQFGIRKKGRRKEEEINTLLEGVEERKKPDPRAGRNREGLGQAKVPEKKHEGHGGEPDEVPTEVALALKSVMGRNLEEEQFINAYGDDRGRDEYLTYLKHNKRTTPESIAAQKEESAAIVEQAKQIAEENGWDWDKVVAMARKDLNLNENWQTPEEARQADAIDAYKQQRVKGDPFRPAGDEYIRNNLADARQRQEKIDAEKAEREYNDPKNVAQRKDLERQEEARQRWDAGAPERERIKGHLHSRLDSRLGGITPGLRQEILSATNRKQRNSIVSDVYYGVFGNLKPEYQRLVSQDDVREMLDKKFGTNFLSDAEDKSRRTPMRRRQPG